MTSFAALTLLAALVPAAPPRAQPIESVDAFEASMTRCLATDPAPASCFDATVAGHFPPGNDKVEELLPQISDLFAKWLGKDRVFAVHPIKVSKAGNFAQRRVYLVEDSAGNIMMLETSFVRRLGKWYVHKCNISSTQERIQSELGDAL